MNENPIRSASTKRGIPAAPGYALGQAVFWGEEELGIPRYPAQDSAGEERRLDSARAKARAELAALQAKLAQGIQSGEADVFVAQQMFIDDIALLKNTRAAIAGGLNAEASWMDSIEAFAAQLEALPSSTLSARAADIRDVGRRVLRHLLGRPTGGLQLEYPAVIIAADLSPSQTAALDKDKVLAFCTAEGGPTSHTAILAKALGLPAVVALGPDILCVTAGSLLLVDGIQGEVIIDPDEQALAAFKIASDRSRLRLGQAAVTAAHPAVTRDGVAVEVVANIGGLEDARAAVASGAEGVGLFRTEFLYLSRTSLPSEAEQVQAYRQVFDALGSRPIVVRTLDIGGDKAVSYLGLSQEANPFLGWRAIRMNEGRPDIYSSQLRALLQAGAGKDLRIMLPMVSNLAEVLQAKRILVDTRRDLQAEGLPSPQSVQFGIMVEVPSAALLSDRIAPHVDFFSIGTNDLTQYTLAVDRTNSRVAHLASPYHPAVLKLIGMTIASAHAHGKWVGLCGELAGEVLAAPLLLGLGLDEFSMAPALIPALKGAIRKCTRSECQAIANQALSLSITAEVMDLLSAYAAAQDLL